MLTRSTTTPDDPLLRLPVEALSKRLVDAVRLNPLLEIKEPSHFSDPTGWVALDRDVLEFDDEGTQNVVAPVDLTGDRLELLEGLDSEFDDHFQEDQPSLLSQPVDLEAVETSSTLYQQVADQLERLTLSDQERSLAELLLGNLNATGYLDTPLHEVATMAQVAVEEIEAVLKRLQDELEPAGVAARSPQESLLIQLSRRGGKETMGSAILKYYFNDLLHGRWKTIARHLRCSVAEVEHAIHEEIAPLTLSLSSSNHSRVPLVPDLMIQGEKVVLNEEPLPEMGLSPVALKWMEEGCTPAEQRYLERQLSQAKRLLKRLEKRNATLIEISQHLVDFQAQYMVGGDLKPLTLRQAAQALALPLTTIQRAVAGKLISTPRGILPLRALFTNGYASAEGPPVASQTIRAWMMEWICQDNAISDAQMSARLQERGIQCARRTVAKYRSQLHLPGALQRRKKSSRETKC